MAIITHYHLVGSWGYVSENINVTSSHNRVLRLEIVENDPEKESNCLSEVILFIENVSWEQIKDYLPRDITKNHCWWICITITPLITSIR